MPGHIPFPSFCAVGTDNYFSFIFICRLNKNFTSTVQIKAGITTVAFWTFTFHKKNKAVCSKFGRTISNVCRGQTNQLFLSENSDLKII